MEEGLSINSINNTSEDVVVTYTPTSDVASYSYAVIKDNIYEEPVFINSNESTNITFDSTGIYVIEITNLDYFGNRTVITSGEYKIDKDAPVINLSSKTYKITAKENFDFMNGVTASDIIDGDLTSIVSTNAKDIDFSKEGIKTIEYSVSDSAGNTTKETVFVTVIKDNTDLIRFGQVGIVIIVLGIILFLIKYIRSIRLEKRFSKYTINSSKNYSISLFDNLYVQYQDFINKFSKFLSKSEILKKRAKRYDKYTSAFDMDDIDNMKFMANKIIVGIIFILVAILVKLVQSMIMQPYEMIIPFIIGFYTLDIIYVYKYIKYKKKIENDMLEAITVMNNAFKAGRSIIQAVDLVSTELKGPISKEFKKISLELSLGLDVEVAFRRFAERIKVNEALYLTSSLSVLNKTGGNIIKVFDSIEKTMFSRRKLQEELKALTSSSKLITYVLIFVPIIFVIFISIINKEYFEPLFTNPLGVALILIMLIIYITYIIIVKKVMKVRM